MASQPQPDTEQLRQDTDTSDSFKYYFLTTKYSAQRQFAKNLRDFCTADWGLAAACKKLHFNFEPGLLSVLNSDFLRRIDGQNYLK